jgi:hypothetical protein
MQNYLFLPVVLYGCENWSLPLREKYRLKVYENRVLLMIFWPKKGKIRDEWGRLHNEELYDLYSSPNIIRVIKYRRMRWAGRMARMRDRRGAYRAMVRRPERKIPLEIPRRKW